MPEAVGAMIDESAVRERLTRGPEAHQGVRGRVVILSGPSGVGKDSVTTELKRQGFRLSYGITATTRPPRKGEVDGVHYYFLDETHFEQLRATDQLLEWAVVHGKNYGIPRWSVSESLKKGDDVMLTVDVQGGETLRRKLPGAIFIFLAPPNLDDLRERLEKRALRTGETRDELNRRLQRGREEMEQLQYYDYLVLNHHDRLEEAAETVKSIIIAERCRVNPRLVVV